MLLKKPKFGHFTKKMEEQKNQTIGPFVSFRMFQKFMKDAWLVWSNLLFIIANLNAYGFDQEVAIRSYLSDRSQKVKKYIIVNTINFKHFLPNLYYI